MTVRPGSPRARGWLLTGLGLAAGAALWEIAGRETGAAFMAPLSETLLRLAELARTGELRQALASSLALFGAGFALSVAIGVPFGLLLARVRLLRVALEGYIAF